MRHWTDLFTYKTWQEFLQAGASVSGFSEKRWSTVKQMKSGDILLCYMTGISRFFALLEVTGEPYLDESPIWQDATFPARVPVRVVLSLSPEHAVPVASLAADLSYFKNASSPYTWTGHFRGSPTLEKPDDAEIIVAALKAAVDNPISRDYDSRKLHRSVYQSKSGPVSIPSNDEEEDDIETGWVEPPKASITHEEIQWLLLTLGQEMRLDVWVAKNDRTKSFQGQRFDSLHRLTSSLPIQFDQATNRTIELIDVLWLDGNSIIAAFEIEHTTAVYSGLLRMADLITMQPNINIPLYIVAPDEREEQVLKQINRPVFRSLKKSLPKVCRFIPYSALTEKVEQAKQGRFLQYLRPEFLDELAQSAELEEV